jgi:hypothetical protein
MRIEAAGARNSSATAWVSDAGVLSHFHFAGIDRHHAGLADVQPGIQILRLLAGPTASATGFLRADVFIDEHHHHAAAEHREEIAPIHARPPFAAAAWMACTTRE